MKKKTLLRALPCIILAAVIAAASCFSYIYADTESGPGEKTEEYTELYTELYTQEAAELYTEENTEEYTEIWLNRSSGEIDSMVGTESSEIELLSTSYVQGWISGNFYGGDTAHLQTTNGDTAFCVLPWSKIPESYMPVDFCDYDISSSSDTTLQLMAKLIYYGIGAESILSNFSINDREAITHFALGYVWMMFLGNTHGLADPWSTGSGRVNETGQTIVLDFISRAGSMPAVRGVLHAASLYTQSGNTFQDVVYGYFEPEITYGKVKIRKTSRCPGISAGNSMYSLEGAVYGVYRSQECNDASRSATLTTGKDGSSPSATLESGVYYVKEISAPKGFFLNSEVRRIEIQADTEYTFEQADEPFSDPIPVLLRKTDSETGSTQGMAKLEGAEYTFKYYDVIMTDDPAQQGYEPFYKEGWVFRTDDKGRIDLDAAHFVSGPEIPAASGGQYTVPLGTLTVQETKAPEGYQQDSTVYVINITADENGNIRAYNVTEDKDGGISGGNLPDDGMLVKEQIIRSDLKFKKVDEDGIIMPGIPFEIKNLETGETQTITTDENGIADTTDDDTVWFGEGEPDKTKGSLIYGKYMVTELKCEANKNKKLVEFETEVNGESGDIIEIGNVVNYPFGIKTEMTETGTEKHLIKVSENISLTDRVSYRSMTPGKEYTLKGILMDRETGKALIVNGKEVTAEKTFVPEDKDGVVEVVFEFDATGLEGRSVVSFETLYSEGKEVCAHADINDEGQTVSFEKPVTPSVPRTKSGTPSTGDGNAPMIWGMILAGAAASGIGIICIRKRKRG